MKLLIIFLVGNALCSDLALPPVPSETQEVKQAEGRDLLLERRIDIQCRQAGCQRLAHCCNLVHYHLCASCPVPVRYLSQEALDEALEVKLQQAIRPEPGRQVYHVVESLFSSLVKTPTSSQPIKTVKYDVAVDKPLAIFSSGHAGQPFKFRPAAADDESGSEPARPIYDHPVAVGNSTLSQPVTDTFPLDKLHEGPRPSHPFYVQKENFVRVTPKPVTVIKPGFYHYSNSSFSIHRTSTFTRSKPVITTVTKVTRGEPLVRGRHTIFANKSKLPRN